MDGSLPVLFVSSFSRRLSRLFLLLGFDRLDTFHALKLTRRPLCLVEAGLIARFGLALLFLILLLPRGPL